MYIFENVKFHMIKNKLIEDILKNIYELLVFHKNIFLTDRLRFNGLLDLNTGITFFFEDQQELNRYEKLIIKF